MYSGRRDGSLRQAAAAGGPAGGRCRLRIAANSARGTATSASGRWRSDHAARSARRLGELARIVVNDHCATSSESKVMKKIPITIAGVEDPSIIAAAVAFHAKKVTVRKRFIELGWAPRAGGRSLPTAGAGETGSGHIPAFPQLPAPHVRPCDLRTAPPAVNETDPARCSSHPPRTGTSPPPGSRSAPAPHASPAPPPPPSPPAAPPGRCRRTCSSRPPGARW